MRVAALLMAILTTGCGAAQEAGRPEAHDPTPTVHPMAIRLTGGGTFEPYKPGATAVAYDPKLVPKGAEGAVVSESVDSTTVSTLTVKGMLPSRTYGAHLHTKPCGAKPDDSGPHYQHAQTPGAPSHHMANPHNEVWLDFTTDGTGAGTATARQSWAYTPDRLPGSLIIHERKTTPEGPEAGTAGARVACLTLKPHAAS
ncbi:superoxide dismutase, Cu-Zn family [Sinosporangium album]|uniref:Superoxide dismutase, Cu-Zn family n=1 Tax=Sinosporangium album TaxID=504805 RepID=A0A1G8C483_9ACTN|nr:superoxide dismutase family protein [Sinosporangium album]SDH40164.1 superoxide dismutase, Cu-Zn family [Sinosporangium album]